MEQKDCVQCGTSFYGASNKLYCSNACKQSAFREKQHTQIPELTCADMVWFTDWCIAHQYPQQLKAQDLADNIAQFERVLRPFVVVYPEVASRYLEVCENTDIDDSVSSHVINLMGCNLDL